VRKCRIRSSFASRSKSLIWSRGFSSHARTIDGTFATASPHQSAVSAIIRYEYRLLATKKTSTLQKELAEAGDLGFGFVGMTVAKTLVGGDEVVAILRRKLE
jgi:hypothetical protein